MTLTNVYEMAEGRFDEETFEDAYLADIESNFDNEESQIIDDDRTPVLPPAEQYCLKCLWLRPSLFTILEERTDNRITNEMSIPEECERMHDLFEEEGFEDAPLSDVESNFDEEGLISADWCTPVLPPAEQYCLKRIWARPAPSTISEERTDQSLMSQPASSSPRSLVKVLDDYKRNRVKARRACGTLPPRRSTMPSPISSKAHEVGHARTVTNSADVWVIRVYLDRESPGTAIENTPCSRPCSASSLSAKAGVQCSSQRMIDVAKRSVLYIPQFEVAFGFVSIGDAAVSTVDVTNRTDRSLRLRAKLSHSGTPFALLDSQILVLDARQTTSLRIEFSPTQNARFCTSLLISVEGGGGPQMKYRMPVRGLGGAAVVTVKTRDDLRLSRKGTYILQSSYESTFSFGLTNSGNRRAFARIIVLYTGEPNVAKHVPVDIRPASGVVIDRGETQQVSVRLRSPLSSGDWRSSHNSIVSAASTTQARRVSQLRVIVYWGEERTRRRLRCVEKITGTRHTCEGIQFTDSFVGEDPAFQPPADHPISKEDIRLFDQTLRMCIIYACSPKIGPRPSLAPESLERSLQLEDTFREKITRKPMIPDRTLRQ